MAQANEHSRGGGGEFHYKPHSLFKKLTQSVSELNVRHKIIKLLGRKLEGNPQNLGLDEKFLDLTLKAHPQQQQQKINELHLIIPKIFCSTKDL